MTGIADRPPAILLGSANALSVARSLGRHGIDVSVVGYLNPRVGASRYCRTLPTPHPRPGEWSAGVMDFLLGERSRRLRGGVLLACDDFGIELLARHRGPLGERYLLDLCDPAAQLAMLDKLATYRLAEAAGVPVPRFRLVSSPEEVDAPGPALRYPLLVKPLDSVAFQVHFGTVKHFGADDPAAARRAVARAADAGQAVMLVERIPGPDVTSSYYTYLDADGVPAFHYTKRQLRRHPPGMGEATYHVSDWVPEVRDLSLRLFREAGLLGVANAEFKRDPRDGELKLIEVNARFTGGNAAVVASGVDIATFVYDRITGRPHPAPRAFRTGVRLWNPGRDVRALRALRAAGELSMAGWVATLRPSRLSYFAWDDPMPSVAGLAHSARGWAARRRR